MSRFQVWAVGVYLNNGISSVGPPPSDIFNGCTLVRSDAIIFADFSLLLVLELSEYGFLLLAHAYSPVLMTVVVILTVGIRFRDRVYLLSLT